MADPEIDEPKLCKACPRAAEEMDYLCSSCSRLYAKNPKAYYERELKWLNKEWPAKT